MSEGVATGILWFLFIVLVVWPTMTYTKDLHEYFKDRWLKRGGK